MNTQNSNKNQTVQGKDTNESLHWVFIVAVSVLFVVGVGGIYHLFEIGNVKNALGLTMVMAFLVLGVYMEYCSTRLFAWSNSNKDNLYS